jgi:hypothetical protein
MLNLDEIGCSKHAHIRPIALNLDTAMDFPSDLGPLPESDGNSILQAESFKALEIALPAGLFVLRHEPQPDAGVDWCVELRIDGHFTGMRAHIQVKACATKPANSDGSISFSADVSNLNYLLFGLSPMYILYVADTKTLRYAWVRDEVNRIEKENPGWKQQRTVTLRFTHLLDETGIQVVHDRIRRDAKLDREIHNVLSLANASDKTIHVNIRESKVTDPDEITKLLLTGGMTLIADEDAGWVLNAVERLNPSARRLPRILLIRAFAEYTLGRYLQASADLAEISVRGAELSESDREFLVVLSSACAYREGRITAREYIERQKASSERAEGEFGLTLRVEYLWHELLEEQLNREVFEDRINRLRSTVEEIIGSEKTSDAAKVRARIAWLHCKGMRVVNDYNHGVGIVESRVLIGGKPEMDDTMGPLKRRLQVWVEEANQLVADAHSLNIAAVFADAVWVRAVIMFAHFSFMEMKLNDDGLAANRELISDNFIPDLEQAIRCYEASGHLESELRAKILLADYLDLMNERVRALELARGVLPVALAYRYEKIAADAERHVSGAPFFRKLQEHHRSFAKKSWEFRLADETEDGIRKNASDLLETLKLPSCDLGTMIRQVECWRDVARERISWCRYIDLVDDTQVVRNPLAAFRAGDKNFAICEKHGYRSRFGSPDWAVVLKVFKENYCNGCPDRDPKQGA